MKIKLNLSYGGNLNIIEECRADLGSQSKISFHRESCLLESQNILQNIRSPRYAKIFIMIYSVFKCFFKKVRKGHQNWESVTTGEIGTKNRISNGFDTKTMIWDKIGSKLINCYINRVIGTKFENSNKINKLP